MEQVRDLNMEADDMQVVLSAISSVSRRIKEVAQTAVWWRTFPNGQGGVRAAVYQPPHLAGLSGQEDYPLHAVCREDTL